MHTELSAIESHAVRVDSLPDGKEKRNALAALELMRQHAEWGKGWPLPSEVEDGWEFVGRLGD